MGKKVFILLLFICLPIVAVWLSVPIRNIVFDTIKSWFSWEVAEMVGRYELSFISYFIFAAAAGYIIWKWKLSLNYLGTSALALIAFTLIRGRYFFYYYQARPELYQGDLKFIPECEFESNFSSYWDYLVNGCHYNVDDVARWLIDRTTFWLIVALLLKILLESIRLRRHNRKSNEVLD